MTDKEARRIHDLARKADSLINSRDEAKSALASLRRYKANGAVKFRFCVFPEDKDGRKSHNGIYVTLTAERAVKEWGAFLQTLAKESAAELAALTDEDMTAK